MQYLYLIKCQQFYKIGIANDVEARLAQLSTGNPFELKVMSVFGYDNAEIVERAIHQRYAGVRKRGEWFELDDHDVIDFQHICMMLGGDGYELPTATDKTIEEAEEIAETDSTAKFDYAAMFADGWRMAEQGRGSKYWNWRRGSTNRETIYGGRISDLPYSIEEMRRIYRDEISLVAEKAEP